MKHTLNKCMVLGILQIWSNCAQMMQKYVTTGHFAMYISLQQGGLTKEATINMPELIWQPWHLTYVQYLATQTSAIGGQWERDPSDICQETTGQGLPYGLLPVLPYWIYSEDIAPKCHQANISPLWTCPDLHLYTTQTWCRQGSWEKPQHQYWLMPTRGLIYVNPLHKQWETWWLACKCLHLMTQPFCHIKSTQNQC